MAAHHILVVSLVMPILVAGCMGYVPGRQLYWDERVKEMCGKDGGVTVYERVTISEKQAHALWGSGVPLPNENSRMEAPYYWERIEMRIRESSPEVLRGETRIKRRSDGKLLGKSVQYWRVGGDIPTGFSEATSFICPQHVRLSEDIFTIDRAGK